MSQAYVFLAKGFEEVEALTAVDLMRRGEVQVTMVSITEEREVEGAHGITVKADAVFSEVDFEHGDMLVLPGGLPGTDYLEGFQPLTDLILDYHKKGKKVAAICAAPRILGKLGLLRGQKATSYPSVTDSLINACVTENPVEVSGNLITSRGVGTAVDFGLELAAQLCGCETSDKIRNSIVYNK